ncbi:MCM DNA helicase complex subunit MCM2 [Ascoidea rubescens DSM 1968]|uniref:DNA replication licensing factor MCM2 n=1 Tax=Ascoidea rubescens DSM 1968 TaxID=1344418 RepID=A0A1D2VKN7_9ASCO|nr:DNA replication licensing factor, MCM2 component [Ascoidea rubescens DSM 1968]ODV62166.1 DNA replication licensing factor, MCM2 component [Ascoidea rubescens DSM 1968]
MPNSRKRQASHLDDENDEDAIPILSSPGSPNDVYQINNLPPSSPGFPLEEDDREIVDEIDDLDEGANEVDGVDLFGDNMFRDYKKLDKFDHYDSSQIDDNDYGDVDLDIGGRREVDDLLNKRDRFLQKDSLRNHGAFLDDEDDEFAFDDLDQNRLPRQQRRRRFDHENLGMLSDNEIDEDPLTYELNLEELSEIKAPSIREWILSPPVQRSISRELRSFLLEYTDEKGRSYYGSKIKLLGEINSESLEVNYQHLINSKPILAFFLSTSPEEIITLFDQVAIECVQLHYSEYAQIHSDIHVRITNFSPNLFNLRELRENHLNSLVKVSGVVTRRTGVFPQLKHVKFDCSKCGVVLGPYYQGSNQEVKVSFCSNCHSRGPFKMNSEVTTYSNYQQITIQEPPGTVPAGRLPRHKDVILLWDLVDMAKPGQLVSVTGIYKNSYNGYLNAKNGFPVFATVIEANSIQVEGSSSNLFEERNNYDNSVLDKNLNIYRYSEEEESLFRKISKERGIVDKLINSIAPSIYGHRNIKTAIACSLFGGVPKDVNGKHSIRGDINVLVLGDPGTAKSQILKYVEKTAYRAVYSTGQGASGVGLTASVRKDPVTNEWTLEGGALVLADKGTCIIDEFDKMHDRDRTSIHEAMEQQSISISKAGIVTTLQARCAVIAAANPIGGKYNSTMPLSQNVDLTEPILSRFDIICIVRDLVDPVEDERLAKFVIDSHFKSLMAASKTRDSEEIEDNSEMSQASDVSNNHGTIEQDVLTKYIHYSKRIKPKLNQMDMQKVSQVYADLRKQSIGTGSMAITVRHLEAILRISESFARMRLSEFVSSSDLDRAIKVSVDSFIGTQKLSVRRQLQKVFMKYTLPRRN